MDVYILNSNFETIGIIDVFKSLIWTTRYYEAGDFELYTPATIEAISILALGNYIVRENDTNAMIIEKLEIKTDINSGNFIIVSGRDLKSIFDRRVIFPQYSLTGNTEAALYDLVNAQCGSTAAVVNRRFTNFSTAALKGFTETINAQVTGAILLDYLVEVCKSNGYGWQIKRNNNALVFEIYKGVARPDVEFSPEFDSLINSDYIINCTTYKNTAYIAGEGEGILRKSLSANNGAISAAYNRREMFVDARDISSNDGQISNTDYYNLLTQRGKEKLAEMPIIQDFSGSTNSGVYTYKTDYDIGDIVTVVNEYGITAEARIIEIIESWSAENGYTAIPTFEKWEV